jgi:hypothetical protein
MRKRAWMGILLFLLGGGGTPATAQQNDSLPKLQRAVHDGWLRFGVVSGRIVLESVQVNNVHLESNKEKTKESLSIRWGNEESVIEYERLGPQEQFVLKMTNGQQLELRRTGRGASAKRPVAFVQNPHEKLVFTVGSGSGARRYVASTLWHLILAAPDETRQSLLPCLELLLPEEKLAETAADLETALLRKAQSGVPGNRPQWKKWVAQLGDERFAKRQAADRALRACDPAVLSYLQQLDFRHLDAEQQYRVQRIIEAFSRQINDNPSPEQIASWLAGDPTIWLSLLTRADAALRRTAVQQLEILLDQRVAIDPEADPATQKNRIEQLRGRLEGN